MPSRLINVFLCGQILHFNQDSIANLAPVRYHSIKERKLSFFLSFLLSFLLLLLLACLAILLSAARVSLSARLLPFCPQCDSFSFFGGGGGGEAAEYAFCAHSALEKGKWAESATLGRLPLGPFFPFGSPPPLSAQLASLVFSAKEAK